tara:strand:- start:155 stop:1012 length:858 start_codon:yes stop_codon:yes gene_type:complete
MNNLITKNLYESNEFIINLIKSNKSFFISRVGIGSETYSTYHYEKHGEIGRYETLDNNAGIYYRNKEDIIKYNKYYSNALKNSDGLATWNDNVIEEQKYFINKYELPMLHYKVIEPFYQLEENIIPWTHYLNKKKILIISPFISSFKSQLKDNFKMYKNQHIFLDNQEFIFYKCLNTSAGNRIEGHTNWLYTYLEMIKEIKKLDFDIALVSAGGYGLPICNYIKEHMKKSSIYVGGGLQLLFGVIGNRWINDPAWIQRILESPSKFIKPIEKQKNSERIENSCYY